MKQTLFTLVVLFFVGCSTTTDQDQSKLFRQFVRSFKTIELPMKSDLLYRVHSNEIISTRIDTLMIQQFIDKEYKLKADMPVYDGYAYGIRLPREDSTKYEGLIYYQSKGREQFFILNTYSLEGQLIHSLPISGDSSSYKRLTGRITKERNIIIRDFVLNQPEKGAIEYIYNLKDNGSITPQDTFYQK